MEGVVKALAVILFLFAISIVTIGCSSEVLATQGVGWTSGIPNVAKNVPMVGSIDNRCATYTQEIFVTEYGSHRTMCVYGDDRLKLGVFFENGSDVTTVQFPYSNTMHVLEGACSNPCRYSAGTDTLITLQRVSQYGRGLVVFRHVSDRIKRVVVSSSTVRYVFDGSNPDYAMKNDLGQLTWVSAINFSRSGNWVVAELYDHGIAVLNIETMEVIQVATSGHMYGQGMDPTEELAISDDGKSLAVTGQNAGFQVIDVIAGCGQRLIGPLTSLQATITCPSSDLGIGQLFPNFRAGHMPRFFGDGHQLEVVVNSWTLGARRVTYVTQGTPITNQLKLLSIGDSFASGEGEINDTSYEPGTNTQFDSCHVSTRAYSALIARSLDITTTDAKNLACSGAKISDIIGSNDEYWGQRDRLGAAGLGLSYADRMVAQEDAVNNFQPGRTLQSSFIERYNPANITIGIGGNDAGLMGKLRTCAMPGTCEWAQGDGIKQTADEIRRLFDSLGSFFSRIAASVEDSNVFILGYPDIVDPEGRCDPVTMFLMDHVERVFVQNSIHYLNTVIRAAADKAGFHYVDVEHSFDGTNLCSVPSSSSMNGLRMGDDIAVIDALPMLKVIGAETFHPTPAGHELLANTILNQYPALIASPSNIDTIDIEPASYWGFDERPSGRAAYATDFAYTNSEDKTRMKVSITDKTLQPYSIATVEIRSDPVQLATFVVDEKGGLNGTIAIPASLAQGFHTLHLLASNIAGDQVDLYQFITIGQAGLAVSSDGDSPADTMVVATTKAKDSTTPLALLKGVLGAESTEAVKSSIQDVLSPATLHIILNMRPIRWILFGIAVCVLSVASTVIALLVSRRWAKSSS